MSHSMEKVTLDSWHARLACGKEISGKEYGPFRNVKNRLDIVDLWVVTGAGKVHAARAQNERPRGFEFYIRVAMEDEGIVEKKWKLVTLYKGYKFVKHVLPNGRNWIEREVL